jgi:hypothetical protein
MSASTPTHEPCHPLSSMSRLSMPPFDINLQILVLNVECTLLFFSFRLFRRIKAFLLYKR